MVFSLPEQVLNNPSIKHGQRYTYNQIRITGRAPIDGEPLMLSWPEDSALAGIQARPVPLRNELISTKQEGIERAILTLELFGNPVNHIENVVVQPYQGNPNSFDVMLDCDLLQCMEIDLENITEGATRFLVDGYKLRWTGGDRTSKWDWELAFQQPPAYNVWDVGSALGDETAPADTDLRIGY